MSEHDTQKIYSSKQSGDFVIVKRVGNGKSVIRFINTGHEQEVFNSNIYNCSVFDRSLKPTTPKTYNIGDTIDTQFGKCLIIGETFKEGSNRRYIKVRFLETSYETYCTTDNLKRGKIKDRLTPSVHGRGKLGYFKFETNPKKVPEYVLWSGIMLRVGSDVRGESYLDCAVDKDWERFDLFYNLIKNVENYHLWKRYATENPKSKNIFELDKDYYRTKSYSTETTIFIPKKLNAGLTSHCSEKRRIEIKKEIEELGELTYEQIIERYR